MVVKIADNIMSPLALTTAGNFDRVVGGESMLMCHPASVIGVQEDFFASMFGGDLPEVDSATVMTRMESLAVLSATDALSRCDVDPSSPATIFIISTTKGNVELLDREVDGVPRSRVMLGEAAAVVSGHFRNPNRPIVVSNACISGVSAVILAERLLEDRVYDHAVVIGVDVLSKFIVSGFQSFKALSPEACRPFDAERCGLNLGEAAATMILSRTSSAGDDSWTIVSGAVRNDANHISGPSRTGEGSYQAIMRTIRGINPEALAVINVHGTATLYNDEMESIALDRAGLNDVPVNALKGYYGHTLGAAGVLESVLTMTSIDRGVILGTRGFGTSGVSRSLDIAASNRQTDKRMFVKLLSGFGGSNAAVLYRKGGAE